MGQDLQGGRNDLLRRRLLSWGHPGHTAEVDWQRRVVGNGDRRPVITSAVGGSGHLRRRSAAMVPCATGRSSGCIGRAGCVVTTRKTRGDDIAAACGQLAGQVQDKTRRTMQRTAGVA